jgi:hypothetical protein
MYLSVNNIHVFACYHIISSLINTYFVHMHAIGSPKGVTQLEFELEQQEEQ